MNVREYLTVRNDTHEVELLELTETMAENLSEVATVMSVEVLGGKATVWKDRVPRVVAVETGALMELKRRAVWRDAHAGMLS